MQSNPDLWAIGDIHGCLDPLVTLVERIESFSPAAEIVFLGDYVDRGPRIREVVEFLRRGPRRPQDRWVTLRGNHDQMMVTAYREAKISSLSDWEWNGGHATKQAFNGIPPDDVIDWAASLPLYYETENHWFVHAGLEPGIPPEEHYDVDLIWMRDWEYDALLPDSPGHAKHVVNGHTARSRVLLLPHCTGLDTGAVFGNMLSAGQFDRDLKEGPVRLLQYVMETGEVVITDPVPPSPIPAVLRRTIP